MRLRSRDYWIRRAGEMRKLALEMVALEQNTAMPWGERYRAAVMREDAETCARDFDALAEAEVKV